MLTGPILDDFMLGISADIVDDLESVRCANENRLRALTTEHGLDEQHPDVAKLRILVDDLKSSEHKAILQMQRVIRQNPLWEAFKGERGVGEKQFARLLASIGDPAWHDKYNRPRTCRELRAYCGIHVIQTTRTDNSSTDSKENSVGTGQTSLAANHHVDSNSRGGCKGSQTRHTDNGRIVSKSKGVGVAPKRQRGVKSNWDEKSRKRLWLIAAQIVQLNSGKYSNVPNRSRYIKVYEAARAKYADTVHQAPCVRCGPSGKPAPTGSPLSAAHQHARGLRTIMSALLKDIWREAYRLHGGEPEIT